VAPLKDQKNVEMTQFVIVDAQCGAGRGANQKYYGKAPRAFRNPQELLA